MLIAGMNELKEAIAYAKAAESKWPASMKMPDGQFVMTFDSGEKAPDKRRRDRVPPPAAPPATATKAGRCWPTGATSGLPT
mgnify:CR=1 FL=1